MPLTSYCKKCGQDVPVGPRCPDCGSKLAANTVRLAWCVDHTPVRDWMCWNNVLRIALPALGAVYLLTLLLETLLGGWRGLEGMLGGALAVTLTGILILLLALLLLALILQGDDLLDCVVDTRGIHVNRYLPDPTPLKLLLRFKSPRLMDALGEEQLLLIDQKEILWKDIQRVQLWPEKTLILLYAPRWWMRLALPCTPFTWEDALAFIRDKVGKKKTVILPPECRQLPPPKAPRSKGRKEQQLSIDDVPPQEAWLPPQPIPDEEVPPDWTDTGSDGELPPLEDVFDEIRAQEDGQSAPPP